MKMYESFSEWWGCVKSTASHLSKGFCFLIKAVFVGIASVLCALWRLMAMLVGKYPSIALGGFLVAVFLVWMITFVSMRARAVGAEAQRDSIAWQYTEFKEQHGYE